MLRLNGDLTMNVAGDVNPCASPYDAVSAQASIGTSPEAEVRADGAFNKPKGKCNGPTGQFNGPTGQSRSGPSQKPRCLVVGQI